MNAGSEALNLLRETQKRVIPYCKIAFGNVASTLKLLDCGYLILWQAWQFLQGGVLEWIR